MEKIIVRKNQALKKRYKLRRTGQKLRSWETTIPPEVVEREATRAGIPLFEFQKYFEAEWLFDNFVGLHLILSPNNKRREIENAK